MATIAFDADSADVLIAAARHADGLLREEAFLRRGAVETAVVDFAGAFAKLFMMAASTESEDRGRLAGVLDDLARQVEQAKVRAAAEQKRVVALAGWRVREQERDQRRQSGEVLGSVPVDEHGRFDPKPSEAPIAPPTISAAFSAKTRNRTSGGSGSGKSSADTDNLRTFVWQSRASNTRMEAELGRVRNAWTAFTASCSWVPVDAATFLGGFERLLSENQADATWIDQVAAAFDAAGGGSLSDQALNLAATILAPVSNQVLLDALASLSATELAAMLKASPGLQAQLQLIDPVIIFAWWQGMNPPAATLEEPFSSQQKTLLDTFAVLFGNLEGIPYGARDYANQNALTAAIAEAENHLVELEKRAADPSALHIPAALVLDGYRTHLAALKDIRKALLTPEGNAQRFLISLTQDMPPLAAVSIGNLDTATNVTYAVPGMNTTTTGMNAWASSAQNIQSLLAPGSAVVAWIGYTTPPTPDAGNLDVGVRYLARAVAGGDNLSAGFRGLAAVRGGEMPQLNVVAHSYGSTTAAVALSQPGVRVNNLITLGSAGLPDSVHTAADLNVDHVYSGQARNTLPWEEEPGDKWAWIGRTTSEAHHVNPIAEEFGSHAFGVDTGGAAGKAVTDHGTHVTGDGYGYLDKRTESLKNTVHVLRGETDQLTPYRPLGQTEYQDQLFGKKDHAG